MARSTARTPRMLLPLHLAGTALLFLVIAAAPPRSGAMLLVPLPGGAAPAGPALANGAALAGVGPTAGSLRVAGERHRLLWPLLRRGILTLSASPVGCLANGSLRA